MLYWSIIIYLDWFWAPENGNGGILNVERLRCIGIENSGAHVFSMINAVILLLLFFVLNDCNLCYLIILVGRARGYFFKRRKTNSQLVCDDGANALA